MVPPKVDPPPGGNLPPSLRIVTANTDFNLGNDPAYLRYLAAGILPGKPRDPTKAHDVIGVQESRFAGHQPGHPYRAVELADTLKPPDWRTGQDVSTGPRGESALVWRSELHTRNRTLTFGAGSKTAPGHTAEMTDRWIYGEDFETAHGLISILCCHYPPKRFSYLWSFYDKALAAALGLHPHPRIVLLDGNAPLVDIVKRPALAKYKLTGHGERAGRGIVGALTSPLVVLEDIDVDDTGVKHGWTDHPSVGFTARRKATP